MRWAKLSGQPRKAKAWYELKFKWVLALAF